jgi:MerR family gold-responsive transcriptional activator of gol and ges genes
MEAPLSIGQLARAAGVTDKTIRFYEQIGVLPAARRGASGYRQYSRSDVDRLVFIRRGRTLGLSLSDLKALTAELEANNCKSVRPRLQIIVTRQLRAVKQQIAEFQALEQQLTEILQRLQRGVPPSTDRCGCLDAVASD